MKPRVFSTILNVFKRQVRGPLSFLDGHWTGMDLRNVSDVLSLEAQKRIKQNIELAKEMERFGT